MRQLLLEMALQISTANISEQRIIHVVKSMLDRAAVHDQCVSQYCGWVSGKSTCCALMPYIQCLQQFTFKMVFHNWRKICVWQEELDSWMMGIQHVWAELYEMCCVKLVMTNGYVEQDWSLQLAKLNHLWRPLKTLVNSAPIELEESCHKLIFEGCQIKCHHHRTCGGGDIPWSDVSLCIDLGGGHLEHLLWIGLDETRNSTAIK